VKMLRLVFDRREVLYESFSVKDQTLPELGGEPRPQI